MPFPANWLEELVAEWLDLDGFVISTAIGVPARAGGKFAPDVVGAKLDNGVLRIRHCEAAMHLIQGLGRDAARYAAKFSVLIQEAVQDHFREIFGDSVTDVKYEKWVITFRPSARVRREIEELGVRIFTLDEFFYGEVLPTIEKWKRTETSTLPADKWLLHMIDCFDRFSRILAGRTPKFR